MMQDKDQIPKMPYEGKRCVSTLFKKKIETAIDFASLNFKKLYDISIVNIYIICKL